MRASARTLTWTAAGLLVVSIAILIGGCARKLPVADGAIPRVILIVVDTLRGDHLGCAGGPVDTPNLDALAARGVRFSTARSHIPITGPSHSSIFTGLLPSEHGVLNNTQVLAEAFDTLPEMAQKYGLQTAAFISLGVLIDRFGLDQGFDSYDQEFNYSWDRNGGEISDSVTSWLRTVGDSQSFFLWAHYSDPHAPYAAPGGTYAEFRIAVDGEEVAVVEANGRAVSIPVKLTGGRGSVSLEFTEDSKSRPNKLALEGLRTAPRACEIVPGRHFVQAPQDNPIYLAKLPAEFEIKSETPEIQDVEIRFSTKHKLKKTQVPMAYGLEVEYVDQEIGRLLAAIENLGWMDDSLIIFAADHGEGIGDHDHIGHIDQLYDSLLHVPLIMVAPGHLPEGVVIDQPVSLVDIFPTVAELAGFSAPEGVRGRSLVSLMQQRGEFPERPHVALTAQPQADSNLEAVIVDGWKLIRKVETGQVALFDLNADPGELTDLAPQYPEDVERLNQILNEQLSSSIPAGTWADLDDESRSRLEALGYVN